MAQAVIVQIIGAPIACGEGVKDAWRQVAQWAAEKLHPRFGALVQIQYFDLFDAHCPVMPTGVQLPLVLVNGKVVTSGGKISVPAIRREIETLLTEALPVATPHAGA